MSGQEVRGLMIRLEATTEQLRREMDRADASVSKATGRIDSQLGKVDSAFDRAAKSAQSAGTVLKGALALAIGGASVGAIIDQAEAYTAVANRLKLVTANSKEFTEAQNAVFSIAQKSGQPLGATAELYQRIATNQKELKLTGQGVAGIVETISKTLVISGSSAESANAALIQLGQAFASGTLRGEELNSVLEQAPALSQAIAKGMGKTVGELRTLGAEGKLTAAAVVAALQAQAGAVDELFNKMQSTIGTALTRIQTSFTRIIGQADTLSGSSTSLAGAINRTSQALDQINVPEVFKVLAEQADTLSQVLNVVLYAALGRVAGGLINWTALSGASVLASQRALAASAKTAQQDLWAAQSKQIDARAIVERQALELKAAEGKVASDRARQVSELGNVRATEATLAAEVALERQRLEAQISEQGRVLSIGRLNGLLTQQAAVIAEIAAAEQRLAATTVATSAEIQAANARVTASKVALAETTVAVNAASIASEKAAAAASLVGRAFAGLRTAGAGLLGILGGPVGLALTAAAVAVSFVDFSDKSKTLMGDLGDLGKSVDQVRAEFNKLNEDQQRAQINTWKDKQLGATLAVENAYKALKSSVESALVEPPNPDLVDPAKIAAQVRAFEKLSTKLDAARASGQALGPILREAVVNGKITPEQLRQWETLAGAFGDNAAIAARVRARLDELTGALDQNTTATQANNQAKAGFTTAGEQYIDTLRKQLEGLQDGGDAIKIANRYLAEHKDLSDADRIATLSYASAIEANKAATKAAKDETKLGNAAAREAATELKNQQKALEDLTDKSAISTKAANDLADAYLAGVDRIREITLQQKVEEELLKTGAGARDQVTEAIKKQMAAEDRRDVSKNIADLRLEAQQTLAQATATLQGADALEAFNLQKSLQLALVGKSITYGSEEYEQLVKATNAQLENNKALEQASEANSIVDRLYPQTKLLRDYTRELESLNKAMDLDKDHADAYRDAIARLGVEYEQNQRAATAWGQFTEGAVDRIDSSFADAWKNIDKGFKGFSQSLIDGFKQLLAELAHLAITKPIILQFASALGIGGAAVQSSGLFGAAGSSGGAGGLLSGASSLYGAVTGWGKAAYSGYQSGGLTGALGGVGDYFGGALTGINAGAGQLVGTALNGGGLTYAPLSYQFSSGALNGGITGLAGVGGALYGYSQSGIKGAVAGGAGGAGGAYLGGLAGSAVGSIIPGLGTALGGAIGTVLGGALGSFLGGSVFGGKWQTKDQGISLGVADGDLSALQFEYQKKKGGLFSSNKKRTRYSALDSDTQSALDDSYAATTGAVFDLFDKLNVTLNDGVLDGLDVAATQISTKGKTADQIQEEITKWFAGVADSVTSAINTATGTGLNGYNFEALTAFVNNLYSVNDVFTTLNLKLYDSSVSGGKLAESLSAMAGGLANLQTAAASYYDNFYTDTEKANNVLDAVRKQFSGLDITFPDTREAFRNVVDGLDHTTDAGQKMFILLTSLAGSAASAYTILEQRQKDALQAAKDAQEAAAEAVQKVVDGLMKGASDAFNALQRSINAQKESINKDLATANTSVSDLTGISNSLGSALKALRGNSDDAVKMLRSQAQATLQSALAQVKAGKSLAGFEGLTDALDTLSGNNTDLYASLEDFNRDQGRTANVVAELNSLNGMQLTSAQQTVKTLQAQLDALDDQLAFAQAQLDALNGVDNSVLTVADAVKAMNAAVVAAIAGLTGKGTAANNGVLIDSIYQNLLGHDADKPGKDYWQGQVASGALSRDQLPQAIKNAAIEDAIKNAYSQSLGHAADAAGAKYWADQVSSGALTIAQLQEAIRNAAAANGSLLPGHATGGLISGPGNGTSDSIVARLSNGEYVMTAAATRMFGTGLLDQMNAGRIPAFATGGPVLSIPSISSRASSSPVRQESTEAATIAELRALRDEIRNGLSILADHARKTSDNTGQLAEVGTQVVGTVQTKVVA